VFETPKYPCDLHLHTVASDGGYSVEELVSQAAGLGLEAIAVTDHDTTASVERGMRAGAGAGLAVIPGVELTTLERYHLLGYYIDCRDHKLSGYLSSLRERSWDFMTGLLGRLRRERGLEVTTEELAARTGEGIPNMSHLLDIMYARGELAGVAFDSPQAVEYFGNPNFMVDFFREFARTRPFLDAAGAVKLILSAGGVPVWAHPQLAGESEVRRLKQAGLMGLEVTSPKHDSKTGDYLFGLCERLELIPTGGTDYHGRYFDSVEHGRRIGCYGVESEIVARLAERAFTVKSG